MLQKRTFIFKYNYVFICQFLQKAEIRMYLYILLFPLSYAIISHVVYMIYEEHNSVWILLTQLLVLH